MKLTLDYDNLTFIVKQKLVKVVFFRDEFLIWLKSQDIRKYTDNDIIDYLLDNNLFDYYYDILTVSNAIDKIVVNSDSQVIEITFSLNDNLTNDNKMMNWLINVEGVTEIMLNNNYYNSNKIPENILQLKQYNKNVI